MQSMQDLTRAQLMNNSEDAKDGGSDDLKNIPKIIYTSDRYFN